MGTYPEALWISNITEFIEGYVRNQSFKKEDKMRPHNRLFSQDIVNNNNVFDFVSGIENKELTEFFLDRSLQSLLRQST